MRWILLALVLLTSGVAGAMDCQLIADIEEAARARGIYLVVEREAKAQCVSATEEEPQEAVVYLDSTKKDKEDE